MDRTYLEIFFLCGMILQVILFFQYLWTYFKKGYRKYFNKRERLFIVFILIGYFVLPFTYVFSTWFSWFDYYLPKFMAFPAIALYCLGVWLFFRAYTELGTSWSPGPDIKESHILVTGGIFRWMRHPMYSALGVIALAQIFILQNWLVGPAFLLLSVPFYKYRLKREEKQLVSFFGDEYVNYKKRTNALIPRADLVDFRRIINDLKLLAIRKRKF